MARRNAANVKRAVCTGIMAAATLLAIAGPSAAQALYGTTPTTSDGTVTAVELASFAGAPDDEYTGVGEHFVTYDLGVFRLIDGAGQDFNVYEVDTGIVEFGSIDVLVSADNLNYFNVESSFAAALDLGASDDAHGNASFRRSFDVGAAVIALGVSQFRYIRIDGTGGGAIGGANDFDLDAIGVRNFIDTTPNVGAVPEPATWAMMIMGFGAAGSMIRRRKAVIA